VLSPVGDVHGATDILVVGALALTAAGGVSSPVATDGWRPSGIYTTHAVGQRLQHGIERSVVDAGI